MTNKAGKKGFTSNGGGGTKVGHHPNNQGFGPFPQRGVTTVSADSTLTEGGHAGVTILSGSVELTGTMPTASSAVGGTYVFRAGSVHAHVLTGSQESNGTLVFTDGTDHGSKLQLGGAEGDSVVLHGDGVSFIVLGSSGSITISGT